MARLPQLPEKFAVVLVSGAVASDAIARLQDGFDVIEHHQTARLA